MNDFKKYSTENLHFYGETFPDLLKKGLLLINQSIKKPNIMDLGCGDGRLIYALYKKGALDSQSKITAVDLSEERIKRVKKQLGFVQTAKFDALNVNLPSGSFDFIICAQLIEHISDDEKLLQEIKRLLQPNGILFISSVIKKKHAMYLYYRGGKFLLDPTHIKEYGSTEEFTDLLKNAHLSVIGIKTSQIKFPLFDLLLRFLIKCGLGFGSQFYIQHKSLGFLRQLSVPIVGYKNIDVLARSVK